MKAECEKFELDLTDYARGDITFLDKTAQENLINHLRQCPECLKDFFDWEDILATQAYETHSKTPESKQRIDRLIEQLKTPAQKAPTVEELVDKVYALINEDKFPEALALLGRALEIDPQNINALYYKGYILKYLGRNEEAISAYSQAISLHPERDSLYLSRGRLYAFTKRPELALLDFNKIIELKPEKFNYYIYRGELYYSIEMLPKAEKDFSRAIELEPKDDRAYAKRGLVYLELQKYKQAIVDFTKIIEISPDDFRAYYYRAMAYREKGDFSSAIKDFENALKIQPSFPEVRSALKLAKLEEKNTSQRRATVHYARRALTLKMVNEYLKQDNKRLRNENKLLKELVQKAMERPTQQYIYLGELSEKTPALFGKEERSERLKGLL
ncbi:MAG: tetratricopeptide repeat protein [Planctomycetota bacterium]|nr:tetratricopeptide repeat protein [Planctomycetota bacterium]MDI6788179.1 tetratricopeptide repeat protein [Planctomycetota bacterium]